VAYYPQVVDIPLIKEKGEMRIDGGWVVVPTSRQAVGIITNNRYNYFVETFGVQGTVSYGLTNITAIQANASVDMSYRYYLQGALGLFKGFENKSVVELYGGYGYGSHFNAGKYNDAIDYNHLVFTQFNIGKTGCGKSNVGYGLGLKVGYLFCNFIDSYATETIYKKDDWVVEPSIFIRIGRGKVKGSIKVNYLWTKVYKGSDYYFPLSIGAGVNISL